MKFKILKTRIIEIFTEFSNIIKENTIRPQLSALYIEVENGKVIFKASNLESELIIKENVSEAQNGTLLVKINLILEYIKLLEDEYVLFETEENTLNVANASFRLIDNENYPDIVESIPTVITKRNSKEFIKSLEKIKFISTSDAYNSLANSIKISFKKEFTEFLSTDSYRLIYLKENIENLIEKDIIISSETLNTITKLLKDVKEEISIGISDQYLVIKWAEYYYSSKLSIINFPNCYALLDNFKYDKEIEMNYSSLKSALKRIITVTKSSSDAKYTSVFNFKERLLEISGFGGNSKTNQKLDIIKSGENLKLSLNSKFVYDYINNVNQNIKFFASNNVSIVKIISIEDENYIYMIMPINTN